MFIYRPSRLEAHNISETMQSVSNSKAAMRGKGCCDESQREECEQHQAEFHQASVDEQRSDERGRSTSTNSSFSQLFCDDQQSVPTPQWGNRDDNGQQEQHTGSDLSTMDGVGKLFSKGGIVMPNSGDCSRNTDVSTSTCCAEFGISKKRRERMKKMYKVQLEELKAKHEQQFQVSHKSQDDSSEPQDMKQTSLGDTEWSHLMSQKNEEVEHATSYIQDFGGVLQDLRDNLHEEQKGHKSAPECPSVLTASSIQQVSEDDDYSSNKGSDRERQLESSDERSLESPVACESNPPSSFSSLFGQILQGFRDNQHCPNQPMDALEHCIPEIYAKTLTPRPLAPHMELMHVKSQGNQAKLASSSEGHATQVESCSSSLASEYPVEMKRGSEITDLKPKAKHNEGCAPLTITSSKKQSGKRRYKRGAPPLPTPSADTQVVGMGFFSQLQDSGTSFNQVLATTEAKKKVPRKRKLKIELLEGIGMGFFSGQMHNLSQDTNDGPDTKKRELSDRIKPLYDWAPVTDERTRAKAELFSPVVLPLVALFFNYSSFARKWSFSVPVIHTIETLLTNFGPKCSDLHLRFSPIDPFMHLICDLCMNLPMIVLAFIYPEAFGSRAYTQAIIFACMEYMYWASAYKDVVLRRKAKLKQAM